MPAVFRPFLRNLTQNRWRNKIETTQGTHADVRWLPGNEAEEGTHPGRALPRRRGAHRPHFQGFPGRGAYVCADFACLERAVKTKALERALQQKIDDSVFETLRAELEGRRAHP